MSNRAYYRITKSFPEQNSHTKVKLKEKGEEIKSINKYQKSVIVFDDFLGPSNAKNLDQFFIGGRHKHLDKFYLSQ